MKNVVSLIVMLLVAISASGQKISAVKAMEKAQAFAQKLEGNKSKGLKGKALTLKRLAQREVLNGTDGEELFVYNIGENNGFVIVSGDERVPEILGYSTEGSINPQDMPENMRWWLQMYADEIKQLKGSAKAASVPIHPAIAPLLTCEWNQGAPYNNMCPKDRGRNTLSKTGCVATAMAQALTAVRPANISAIGGYTKTYHNNTVTLETLPATTINWSILRDKYSSDDNDASAQEVAKLMRYCGQAAKMGYSGLSSGALSQDACKALKQYFGITSECTNIYRGNYDKTSWDKRIYRELSDGRVVMFGGSNFEEGHEFVCDGYDGNGLYHINWGWGGLSNSYFEINHLDPDEQGIGGSNGGYSTNVDAIVNIRMESPDKETIIVPTTFYWTSKPDIVNRTAETEPFKFNLGMLFLNGGEEYQEYEICWGLYDNSDLLVETSETSSFAGESKCVEEIKISCEMGANLGDGTYYIVGLGHQKGATEWEVCEFPDVGTLMMTIKGNQATFKVLSEIPNATPSFDCTDMSIESNPTSNIPTPFTVTVENTGSSYSKEICVVVDGKAVTSIAANLDPGEKETFSIDLTFDTPGKKEIWMAFEEMNMNTLKNEYIQISDKISCTVIAEEICELEFSNFKVKDHTIADNDEYTINTTSCTVTVDIANNSGYTYNSCIGFFKAEELGGGMVNVYVDPVKEVPVNIPSGTKMTVEYTYKNLDESIKWCFFANYKTAPDEWANINWNESATVNIDTTVTGIDKVSVSKTDSDEPIYSLDGRRISTPQHGIYIRGGKKYVK